MNVLLDSSFLLSPCLCVSVAIHIHFPKTNHNITATPSTNRKA